MRILLRIFFKIIIPSFFCASVAASAMRGMLELDTKGEGFSNGDIVDVRFSIRPWEQDGDIAFLRRYVGKTFLEHFHLVNIVNGKFMDDSFVVDMRVVVKKSFDGQSAAKLFFDGNDIFVDIEKNGFVSSKKNIDSFTLLEQPEIKSWMFYYVLGALFAGLILAGSWSGFHYNRKRKQRMERTRAAQEERKKLIFLMKNVACKEDIQKLYEKRALMKEVFIGSRQFKEILKMMNEYQYKSHISEKIILEIRDKLRNGI